MAKPFANGPGVGTSERRRSDLSTLLDEPRMRFWLTDGNPRSVKIGTAASTEDEPAEGMRQASRRAELGLNLGFTAPPLLRRLVSVPAGWRSSPTDSSALIEWHHHTKPATDVGRRTFYRSALTLSAF